MPGHSMTLVASVLKELGFETPNDEELSHAMKAGIQKYKEKRDMNPAEVFIKMGVIIDGELVDEIKSK